MKEWDIVVDLAINQERKMKEWDIVIDYRPEKEQEVTKIKTTMKAESRHAAINQAFCMLMSANKITASENKYPYTLSSIEEIKGEANE